jgi:DNA-binding NarL/FixJ family response regulator
VPDEQPDDDPAVALARSVRAAAARVESTHAGVAAAHDDVAAAYRELMRTVQAAPSLVAADALRAAFADAVDDTDLAILRALDNGVARERIARTVGITRSAVDQRLPRLHAIAGTKTLFQLGRAAFALGWLTDPVAPSTPPPPLRAAP